MSLAPGWRRVFRLGQQSVERDVDDELAFHLTMKADKLRKQGFDDAAADATALARFGDHDRIRDECITIDRQYAREVRLMDWIESVASDLRFTMRTLLRTPVFTAVAAITLALGIGATTAMFTLVDGILLRPLPYPDAARLVRVIQSYPEKGLDTWGLSQENIAMYRDRATDFEAFAGYRGATTTMRTDRGPERISTALVTEPFFRAIGVEPALGRGFTAEEDAPGRNNVAVLSYGLWQTRFSGNPNVLGATIDLDGQPIRVVGVMPRGFEFPRPDVRVWLPMGLDPTRRFGWVNGGLGRLKAGVSVAHARAQTTAIMWDWARRRTESVGAAGVDPAKTKMQTIVTPLHEAITGRSARPLTVLFAAVGLILLIAMANVATLLSSRAAARQREIGLRTALGASSSRIVRQLLTESVVLALIGAALGVALAVGGVRAFLHSSLASLPRMDEVAVDSRVLAFTLVVSVMSGVLFGLLPALHGIRGRLTFDLTAGQRESAHGSTRRANNVLVIAQLSLSVVLLIGAGLVLKSFQRLMEIDLGFRADNVTSIALSLPPRYNSAIAENSFVTTLLDQIRAVPGVGSAALGWSLPFEGNSNVDGYLVEGRRVPPSGNEEQMVQTAVSPGYFGALKIPLLYGRDFTTSDDTTAVQVVVIDETLAARYWTGSDALGKRIRATGDQTWATIIGVVGHTHDMDPAKSPMSRMYMSLLQYGGTNLSLGIRTNSAASVIPAVRATIARLEPSIPLDGVRSLTSVVDQSLATRRLTKLLLSGFAVVAVILASVGVYGVMSLQVANRRREFGIRLAVGADPWRLMRLVLREGALVAGAGVAAGVVGALVVTRWMQSLLYEVSATDPLVFALLPLVLAGVALGACYLPARRAARADPLIALRSE
jgi:putative ABC transport system permease protein